MGFKYVTRLSIISIALSASAAGAGADPAEPLTVTRLGDPEAGLQRSIGSANVSGVSAEDDFAQALTNSVRRQQQSTNLRCRSANKGFATVADRWAWEASCRYRRY